MKHSCGFLIILTTVCCQFYSVQFSINNSGINVQSNKITTIYNTSGYITSFIFSKWKNGDFGSGGGVAGFSRQGRGGPSSNLFVTC